MSQYLTKDEIAPVQNQAFGWLLRTSATTDRAYTCGGVVSERPVSWCNQSLILTNANMRLTGCPLNVTRELLGQRLIDRVFRKLPVMISF